MFNWFKKKVELKDDNCIMCSISNKRGAKLGQDLIVPEHFVCLVYYKNRHYVTLKEGKHKIDKDLFQPLFNKQEKGKRKLKHIKFIAHFINTNSHELQFKIKNSTFDVKFDIADINKFAEFMLLFSVVVDKDCVSEYLIDIFKEVLIYSKLDHKNINENILLNYGIKIITFTPKGKTSILVKNDLNTNNQNYKNEEIAHPENTFAQSKPDIVEQPSLPTCPKCKVIIKFDTKYCLNCGYKLK